MLSYSPIDYLDSVLIEASSDEEPKVDLNEVKKHIKKLMATCRLKMSSIQFSPRDNDMNIFCDFFFRNNGEYELDFSEWCMVYNDLLTEPTFCKDISFFIMKYSANRDVDVARFFQALSQHIMPLIMKPVGDAKEPTMVELSKTLALMNQVRTNFSIPCKVVTAQTLDMYTTKFCTDMCNRLDYLVMQLEMGMRDFLSRTLSKNTSVQKINEPIIDRLLNPVKYDFVSETFTPEFIDEAVRFMNEENTSFMTEAILNNAKEKLNSLNEKRKKFELAVDQGIMRKWKEIRRNQKNRKHAEIVGDASRIMNEIKRVLKALPAVLISPMMPIFVWAITLAFDRYTDNKDRRELITDIQDELEIVEEKIQIADRKGQDKEKMELIRIRQKLIREYERISKVAYQKRGD